MGRKRSCNKRRRKGFYIALTWGSLAQINKHGLDVKEGKSFGMGNKSHVSVDMGSGLIESIAATPANVSDQAGFKHVCPKHNEMVFADKAYCGTVAK